MEVIDKPTLPALEQLHASLARRRKQFHHVLKIGRTHLQDATPIRLGQEFSGYARQIELGIERVKAARAGMLELALGGTAVGTGINTHPEFGGRAIKEIAERTGIPFVEAVNRFEAQANQDSMVFMSGALRTVATSHDENRQRHSLARLRARAAASASCASRRCSRARPLCRAR